MSKQANSGIHSAIWLIGIGLLAVFDWWWPGIMFLVGISALAEGFLRQNEEPSTNESAAVKEAPIAAAVVTPAPEKVAAPTQQVVLPATCPHCGAPTHDHIPAKSGPEICAFCNLPLIVGAD